MDAELFEVLEGKEEEVLEKDKGRLIREVGDGVREGVGKDPVFGKLHERTVLKQRLQQERNAWVAVDVRLDEWHQSFESAHQTRDLVIGRRVGE